MFAIYLTELEDEALGVHMQLSLWQAVVSAQNEQNFYLFIYFYKKCLFIYFERERVGRQEEKGQRESQAVSVLLAQSHTWGSIS